MKPQLNPQELMNYLKMEKANSENLIKITSGEAKAFWEGQLSQIEWTIKYLRLNGISSK